MKTEKIKEVPVISVCVRKKLTLLTDTVTADVRFQKGFSLIEIIMIIIVVSIAIPALLILVGGEAGRGVEPELRITATNVAQQLMEEIRTKAWDEEVLDGDSDGVVTSTTLGPDDGSSTETTLVSYDDADDFNDLGVGDGGVAPCTDTVTVNNVSFTRAVDVCYVADGALNTCLGSKSGCTWTGATPTDYKKITVTITAPGTNWGSSVVMTTVMTNY